jgi:hypothetical protein
MQKPKRIEIARNVLVLAVLIGLVLLSWLLGHILRYSIPSLWHPPIQETDPQIRYGLDFELEGIRRLAVLPGLAPANAPAHAQPGEIWGALPAECPGYTYYTSLPAKCRTVDGRLVQVRSTESRILLIPPRK